MITQTNDRSIVQYRTIVNDAFVHVWEPMSEVQPATLTGLIAYLRVCKWDPEGLTLQVLRDGANVANLGMRKQFFVPVAPTEAEAQTIASWSLPADNVACPICANVMRPTQVYTDTEQNHAFECGTCELVFSCARRIAHSDQIIKRTLEAALKRVATCPQPHRDPA